MGMRQRQAVQSCLSWRWIDGRHIYCKAFRGVTRLMCFLFCRDPVQNASPMTWASAIAGIHLVILPTKIEPKVQMGRFGQG
ncbi:hypothetical protein SUGI_0852410 [Cryptomeria japonica]|nr:hypothetical protein SUGI_0852410 [Cryptomeria japonica]